MEQRQAIQCEKLGLALRLASAIGTARFRSRSDPGSRQQFESTEVHVLNVIPRERTDAPQHVASRNMLVMQESVDSAVGRPC
jgi:hypothetical protein